MLKLSCTSTDKMGGGGGGGSLDFEPSQRGGSLNFELAKGDGSSYSSFNVINLI